MTSAALPHRLDPTALTDAERAVLDRIAREGLHVVHLWAPWCPNSTGPLARGWADLLRREADVSFTFVTVWNDGRSGRDVLARLGLADHAVEVTAPGTGSREDRSGRTRTFLGLPLPWVPTTWLFHRGGELAYAFQYGELEAADLGRTLGWLRRDWSPPAEPDGRG